MYSFLQDTKVQKNLFHYHNINGNRNIIRLFNELFRRETLNLRFNQLEKADSLWQKKKKPYKYTVHVCTT